MKKNENPAAFKNLINQQTVKIYADRLQTLNKAFSAKVFIKNLKTLDDLELKARVRLMACELFRQFPTDQIKSFDVVQKLMLDFEWTGFELWPVSEYFGSYGHIQFERSLSLMAKLTEKFTSEFAIRSYLNQQPDKTYQYLIKMSESRNVHHRRWASEGSRPRLPWGEKLPIAISNPHRGLQILEKLKRDPELYVRKSVSNHLNDISKDHPNLVIQTLKNWQNENIPHFDFVRRQALRTLIKKGHPEALKLMGFGLKDKYEIRKFKIFKNMIKMNEDFQFSFEIYNPTRNEITINVDYVLFFKKNNGSLSPKVFKLKIVKLKPAETFKILKKHKIKKITTRKYYLGQQKLALLVNGQIGFKKTWVLT